MSNLRIGVPSKGRLSDVSIELLREAGLNFRRQERTLFALCRGLPIEITFLRTDDIPVLCAEGAIDLGITGGDLVEESGAAVVERLQLGIGNCRLALCVPENSPVRHVRDLSGQRVATSFPHTTSRFLERHGAQPKVVTLSGSVEIMIALGVAEAIVDLIETGSTLAANQLRILEEIGNYQTVLIQRASLTAAGTEAEKAEMAERIVRRLDGVVIARGWSLLEYHISVANLEAAKKITPGRKSPTVSPLADAGWVAVQAMVERSQVVQKMDELQQLGASAILEIPISNCRL